MRHGFLVRRCQVSYGATTGTLLLSIAAVCLIAAEPEVLKVSKLADKNDAPIKKMAELLRHGATMLAQACPQCGAPLFKVGNDIYCASCDRRIVVARTEKEAESHIAKAVIPRLRETLIKKLVSLNELVESENDIEALTKLANLMVLLLQALHRLNGMTTDENAH